MTDGRQINRLAKLVSVSVSPEVWMRPPDLVMALAEMPVLVPDCLRVMASIRELLRREEQLLLRLVMAHHCRVQIR